METIWSRTSSFELVNSRSFLSRDHRPAVDMINPFRVITVRFKCEFGLKIRIFVTDSISNFQLFKLHGLWMGLEFSFKGSEKGYVSRIHRGNRSTRVIISRGRKLTTTTGQKDKSMRSKLHLFNSSHLQILMFSYIYLTEIPLSITK